MRPQIGDIRLHVSVAGDEWLGEQHRPVIVALHGGPGQDGSKMRHLMRPAADYAQVLVPDQRGHGHSDHGDATRWNLDTWADDVAALIETLGLERPIVLGMSFGGFVVQRYLARHPDQPAAAVLLATSPRIGSPDDRVERFRQVGGDEAAEAMARSFREPSLESEREWIRVCGPLLNHHPLSPDLEQVQRHQIHSTEVNVHFSSGELLSLNLGPGLAAARCPVLVVAGEHDPLVPPELSAEIVAALPEGLGRLHVVPDAGHSILSDQPDAAHAVIRAFVDRAGAPAAARGSADWVL